MGEHLVEKDALVRDVVEFRTTYVNGYLDRRVNAREGNFSDEEFARWEREAHETWRRQYPAFTALLPSHLPTEEVGCWCHIIAPCAACELRAAEQALPPGKDGA